MRGGSSFLPVSPLSSWATAARRKVTTRVPKWKCMALQARELTPRSETSLKRDSHNSRFAVDRVTSDRGTLKLFSISFYETFLPPLVRDDNRTMSIEVYLAIFFSVNAKYIWIWNLNSNETKSIFSFLLLNPFSKLFKIYKFIVYLSLRRNIWINFFLRLKERLLISYRYVISFSNEDKLIFLYYL